MDIQRYINDVDLLTLQLSAEYTPYAGSALETYSLSSSQISTAVGGSCLSNNLPLGHKWRCSAAVIV